jgi:hypothetical protein
MERLRDECKMQNAKMRALRYAIGILHSAFCIRERTER